MKGKQLISIMLIAVLAVFVAACGSDSDDDKSATKSSDSDVTTPSPLTAGGNFVVCTDVPYPPAEYLEGDKFVGYEIDFMNEVADRLNTTAEYEKTLFDAIIPALQAKQCDAIVSSMNVTEEREKEVSFVKYMEIGQSFMVAADSDKKESLNGLSDLAGMTVAVQVGTTLKDALDEENKNLEGDNKIDVQTFPDGGAAAAALKADKVDVFFADSPVVADYVNKDSAAFAFAGEPIDPLPVGIALRPEDEDLIEALEDVVADMYEDGAMDDLLDKWSISDFALAEEDIA